MKAIILAAGMGTRLGKYTANLPKGMLQFLGKSLIERSIETLRSIGISDIAIVTGYEAEKINFPGITYFHNPHFATTNMVETLMSAKEWLEGEVLVVYSDIIFERSVVEKAMQSKADIGVVVDTDYWDYWQARLDEPEQDMESLVIDIDGKIIDLGDTSCSREKARVRYVGMIKFSPTGIETFKKIYQTEREQFFDVDAPWKRSKSFKKAYMTCMLQAIIDAGYRVDPIAITHGWMEFDTVEDYEKAQEWYSQGSLDRFIHIA